MNVQTGQQVTLDIEKPALGGHGLGRVQGMAVFVRGALPGQRIRARITSLKRRHAWADMLQVLDESADFTSPGCPHFGLCGGCDWLHMGYDRQLHWKRELVRESLRHIGGLAVDVGTTIPSPATEGYRNKMEFAFARPASGSPAQHVDGGPFVLGLHPRGQPQSAVAIVSCRLCTRSMIRAQKAVGSWALHSGLSAYEAETGSGFWRHAVLREGMPDKDILVTLITAHHPQAREISQGLFEHLKTTVPEVRSLVHEVRASPSLLAQGERTLARFGSGVVTQRLSGLELTVSSRSFFQTNTFATEQLYAVIQDFASLTGRETVWDLYTGVGGIALHLARQAAHVVGLEVEPQAVRAARANARRNNLLNSRFLAGDAARTMDDILQTEASSAHPLRPDVIVADPPRSGLQSKVVDRLLHIMAPRLILVSCNPATLARDVRQLAARYAIGRVQPVDMFPHTSHIECVAELVAQQTPPG